MVDHRVCRVWLLAQVLFTCFDKVNDQVIGLSSRCEKQHVLDILEVKPQKLP